MNFFCSSKNSSNSSSIRVKNSKWTQHIFSQNRVKLTRVLAWVKKSSQIDLIFLLESKLDQLEFNLSQKFELNSTHFESKTSQIDSIFGSSKKIESKMSQINLIFGSSKKSSQKRVKLTRFFDSSQNFSLQLGYIIWGPQWKSVWFIS